MAGTWGKRALGVAVTLAMVLGGATACGTSHGSKADFCADQPELSSINIRLKVLASDDVAGAKSAMAALAAATKRAQQDAPGSLKGQITPIAQFWSRFNTQVQAAKSADEMRKLNVASASDKGNSYAQATTALRDYVSRNCTIDGGTRS